MQSYKEYTDEELLSLLNNNDSNAFAELYNRHWERLVKTSYYFTHDKQAVEEIVNDVFIRLWNRPENFQIRSLSTYLNAAVKFGVFKELNKAKRRKVLLEAYTTPICSIDEEAHMEAKFMATYFNEVVESLPQKSKMIFRYSRQDEMSIVDISRKMKMHPKTVEYHITKSLKKLRRALQTISGLYSFLIAATILVIYFYNL